jgi:drug/metabolite transporter (DMT)-like permease
MVSKTAMDGESVVGETATQSRDELVAYLGLTFSSFAWASAFIAGKVALAEMSQLVVAVWRYVLATMILLPFALRARPLGRVGPVLRPLTVMIVCGGIAYPLLFLMALDLTSATNTSLLIALNPVFTVLLVPLVGERLSRRRAAGVALALFGAVTVITRGELGHLTSITLNGGDLLAVAAAGCWAAFNLASRGTVTRLSPAFTNAVIYGAGAVALAVLAISDGPWAQLVNASGNAVAAVAAMAVLSSVLAGQLFLVGVRNLGVSRTVVFVYFVPVLTAVLSTLLLGERFGAAQAIGGAAVLAGVYFSNQ